MRPMHPVAAAILFVVALLIAFLIAPLFPVPLSTIVYWLALIVALVALILGVWGLFTGSWRTGPRV